MKKKPASALSVIAILLTLLMMLGLVVSYYPLPAVDLTVMNLVQSFGSASLLVTMSLISLPGYTIPALVLGAIAALTIYLSPLRFALIPLAIVIPADALSAGLKELVNRPRPSAALVQVHQLLFDPSFPSSHVVHYTVFFGFLAFLFLSTQLLPKSLRLPLATIAIILVCLIPFSRMYLGAHWPTDVVAGYLLGFSMLLVQIRIFQKLSLNFI